MTGRGRVRPRGCRAAWAVMAGFARARTALPMAEELDAG